MLPLQLGSEGVPCDARPPPSKHSVILVPAPIRAEPSSVQIRAGMLTRIIREIPSRGAGDARRYKARAARPTQAYPMRYVEEAEQAERRSCGQIRCRSRDFVNNAG